MDYTKHTTYGSRSSGIYRAFSPGNSTGNLGSLGPIFGFLASHPSFTKFHARGAARLACWPVFSRYPAIATLKSKSKIPKSVEGLKCYLESVWEPSRLLTWFVCPFWLVQVKISVRLIIAWEWYLVEGWASVMGGGTIADWAIFSWSSSVKKPITGSWDGFFSSFASEISKKEQYNTNLQDKINCRQNQRT